MMWRKCLVIGMVFVSSMILLTQSAWAIDAETQVTIWEKEWATPRTWTDDAGNPSSGPLIPCNVDCLTGKWAVLLGSVDEFGEHCWACAKVELKSGGIVKKGVYYDCDGRKSIILGGRFTISPGCTVKGKLETNKGTVFVVPGGYILGSRLELGKIAHPANQFDLEELESRLEYHREDVEGVLLRILA